MGMVINALQRGDALPVQGAGYIYIYLILYIYAELRALILEEADRKK